MTYVPSLRPRLLLIIGLTLLGLLTHSTYAGTGDEPHYLAITQSIAFDHDIDVSNNYAADEWIIGGFVPGPHATAGRNGALRPVHDIGMPLLFAPYVAIAKPLVRAIIPMLPSWTFDRLSVTPATIYRHSLSIGMIAVALLLANELFLLLIGSGVDERYAFLTTLAVLVSPPLSIHSILFFSETVSALLSVVAFRRIVSASNDSLTEAMVAGICTGLLFLVHSRNVGLIVGLTVFALIVARQRGQRRFALSYCAALAAALLLRTAINHHFWGTWLTTPHALPAAPSSTSEIIGTSARRLAGMLIDQEFGLLMYAPMFALAAYALMSRDGRRVALAPALVVVCYLIPVLLPFINTHGWTGGWSPTARFWVPVIPLVAIALSVAAQRAPRAVVAIVFAVQAMLSAYFWQVPKNLWNDGDGVAAICKRGGSTICTSLPSFVVPADAVPPPAALQQNR